MITAEDYQRIFHEIKNEITVIGCTLQLMEKHNPEVKALPYWKETMDDVARLRAMVLDMSALRQNNSLKPSEVDLEIFMSEIHTSSQAMMINPELLILQMQHPLPVCYFDPALLHHALLNLIKNAIEASDADSPVTIKVYSDYDYVHFEVTDHGCGIPQEAMAHLFTLFYTTKENGTGLGLSITKSMIEAQNGTLDCSSVEGEGTTFTIKIPLILSQTGIPDPECEES